MYRSNYLDLWHVIVDVVNYHGSYKMNTFDIAFIIFYIKFSLIIVKKYYNFIIKIKSDYYFFVYIF